MARISEFEQLGADQLEIAISAAEYNNLGTGVGEFQLRVSYYSTTGNQVAQHTLPTAQASWNLDAATGEYIFVFTATNGGGYTTLGNHNQDYQGIVLSSVNSGGGANSDTVLQALMLSSHNADNAGTFASSVNTSTVIPTTTAFTPINQGSLPDSGSGNSDLTLRFDAPNIDSPTAGSGSDLGSSGTGPLICFTRGSLIDTEGGSTPVEDLRIGDKVMTRSNGARPIRWIGHRRINRAEINSNPKLLPVRISAGALGHNLPKHDLLVSRQHRMLVSSKIAARMFATDDALVAAIALTAMPGIFVDAELASVDYFHILLDSHDVIFANGAPSESLFTGPEALKAVSPEAREEILAIFPDIAEVCDDPNPAAMIPAFKRQKRLVDRHVQNGVPFLAS